MATWDIMHVKSLDVEHSVPESEVVLALKEGRVSRDDCVRRAGQEDWLHIYEVSEFRLALMQQPLPSREPPTRLLEAETELIEGDAPRVEGGSLRDLLADVESAEAVVRPKPRPVPPPAPKPRTAAPAKPAALPSRPKPTPALKPAADVVSLAQAAEESEALPYAKREHEQPEDLDMTPMVDVAMQLILFFMVTSAMILQSAIEFPRPDPEDGRAQARETVQPLDKLKLDNIMVKVKADNSIWIDEDKAPTKESELIARLEKAKRDKIINGGIIISAEEAAYHQTVVAAVDAANETAIKPIKMASPKKTEKKKAPTKKRTIKT